MIISKQESDASNKNNSFSKRLLATLPNIKLKGHNLFDLTFDNIQVIMTLFYHVLKDG